MIGWRAPSVREDNGCIASWLSFTVHSTVALQSDPGVAVLGTVGAHEDCG